MARIAELLLCAGLIAAVPAAADACPGREDTAREQQSCRERRTDREKAAIAGIAGGLVAFALGRRWGRRRRPIVVP